ncbi:hypothetical protein B0T19DRAFT_469417 [Cercophora scortea]|uniref:Uncharacterized protein n=1 Tax=Cercophora scortea TaxID=314031 RepID=A0AAE0I315_9PEZI|nr:hypothetical protein B0T19DRAFT_469417 [Cercophora scortea]
MVHYGINALNILVQVGDLDADKHNIVKTCWQQNREDLGRRSHASRDMELAKTTGKAARRSGKAQIFTPQFTDERDYVNSTPIPSRTLTAGDFNWWTNLYQVDLMGAYGKFALVASTCPPTALRFTELESEIGSEIGKRVSGLDHAAREVVEAKC